MPNPRISALAPWTLAAALTALAAPAAQAAPEYRADAALGFSYSDSDVVASGTAYIQGNTSPGSSWIIYDVTSGAGALQSFHSLYSCCVNNASASGTFIVDDLVFASPGGTGGTADVTVNFNASASASLDGSNLNVQIGLGGAPVLQGIWTAGSTASTGVFTGLNGSSMDGSFTSTAFTVPLDVPLTFQISSAGGTGSYQVVSSISTFLTLEDVGGVFNIVSGPSGITVTSDQLGIADNQWNGGGVVSALPTAPAAGTQLALGAPAPNPARGPVGLALDLPRDGRMTFRIYDVRGTLVEEVANGWRTAGRHRLMWTPPARLPAGTYFARAEALGQTRTQRVVVVR